MNRKDDFKHLQKTDKGFILQRFLNGISKISETGPKHKSRKLHHSRGFAEGTIVHHLKFKKDGLKSQEGTTRYYWQDKDTKLGQLNIIESFNDFQFPNRVDCFSPFQNCINKPIFLDENSSNIQKWPDLTANSRQIGKFYLTHFNNHENKILENRKEPHKNAIDEKFLRTPSYFIFEDNIKEYIQQTAQTYKRSPDEKRIEIISNILQKISESGKFLNVNTFPIKTRFRLNSKLTYSYILSKDCKVSPSSNCKSNKFMVDDSTNETTKEKSLIGLEERNYCKYLSISKESPDFDIRRYHMKMVLSDICSKTVKANFKDST